MNRTVLVFTSLLLLIPLTTGKADAVSVDVEFSGTINNTCTINKVSDGNLSLGNLVGRNDLFTARIDQGSEAILGEVEISCIGGGSVFVTPPIANSFDAQNLSAATVNAEVYDSNNIFNSNTEKADANQGLTSNINFNGATNTYYVNLSVDNGGNMIPPGDYNYQTTVIITAN